MNATHHPSVFIANFELISDIDQIIQCLKYSGFCLASIHPLKTSGN